MKETTLNNRLYSGGACFRLKFQCGLPKKMCECVHMKYAGWGRSEQIVLYTSNFEGIYNAPKVLHVYWITVRGRGLSLMIITLREMEIERCGGLVGCFTA